MQRKIIIYLLLGLGLLAFSCSKEEGEGGTASISGRVFLVQHDDDNYLLTTDTVLAAKEDVFIIYGSDGYVGDDVETGFDGQFRFQYLNAGTYTVFAYSVLATGEKVAVAKTVKVERGEDASVGDLYIHSGKAYGTSMIKGWVLANYFNKNGNTVGTDWAYDQRVYIKRVDEPYHFDDTRVGLDGIYMFQKLQPATYVIFTFSQNTSTEVPYPVYDTVTVESSGIIVATDTLRVNLKA